MKIPLHWLKEHISTQRSPEEIARTLTQLGLEVEDFENHIFSIALTPNLAHCASVRGVARELHASTLEKLISPPSPAFHVTSEKTPFSVEIRHATACHRYTSRLIQGVKVAPSPEWLQKKLLEAGVRPINNIVDATQFVMLDLGQPLHAFDFKKIEGGKVVVRTGNPGEMLTTLDGKTHTLTEEMLVIADSQKPLALAGVMGGQNSEVDDSTKDVLLESAFFEPRRVRKTSKALGIHTDASYRFERGTDPEGTLEGLDRATALIISLAGGHPSAALDRRQTPHQPRTLSCRLTRTNNLLGLQLSLSEIETLLSRLGFQILRTHEESVHVQVPSYRHDVTLEIDLIEEIARLYGLDNIHKKEKSFFRTGNLLHCPSYTFEKILRGHLLNAGLQELLTCDLIGPKECEWLKLPRPLIALQNPRSQDQSILRPSCLPGLLRVVRHNIHQGTDTVTGFEIGRVHFQTPEGFVEPFVASLVLSGNASPPSWDSKPHPLDFFDLKGMIENLVDALHITGTSFCLSSYQNFHPGKQAVLMKDGKELGILGEVHPETLKMNDLAQPVLFAELIVSELMQLASNTQKMAPLPLYPGSTRDWTLTLANAYPFDQLLALIEVARSPLLESVSLLDVYRSEKLGSEWKNLTLRFVYRDKEKTISQLVVDQEHEKIKEWVLKEIK